MFLQFRLLKNLVETVTAPKGEVVLEDVILIAFELPELIEAVKVLQVLTADGIRCNLLGLSVFKLFADFVPISCGKNGFAFLYAAYLLQGEKQGVKVGVAIHAAVVDETEELSGLRVFVQYGGNIRLAGTEGVEPVGSTAEERVALQGGEGIHVGVGSFLLHFAQFAHLVGEFVHPAFPFRFSSMYSSSSSRLVFWNRVSQLIVQQVREDFLMHPGADFFGLTAHEELLIAVCQAVGRKFHRPANLAGAS